VPKDSLTNGVWLEWIRTSKARLVFKYEMSHLFERTASLYMAYLYLLTLQCTLDM